MHETIDDVHNDIDDPLPVLCSEDIYNLHCNKRQRTGQRRQVVDAVAMMMFQLCHSAFCVSAGGEDLPSPCSDNKVWGKKLDMTH